MRHAILILVAGALIAAEAKKDAPKKDADLMQGSWTMTEATKNGESAGEDKLKEIKVAFKGAMFTVTTGDETHEVPFKLDSKKKPKAIDASPTSGPYKDKTLLGIYDVSADQLKLCFAEPGKDRPAEFKSEADSGHVLLIMKRNKE